MSRRPLDSGGSRPYSEGMNTNDPAFWTEVQKVTNHICTKKLKLGPEFDLGDIHQTIALRILEAERDGKIDKERGWKGYVFRIIRNTIFACMKAEAVQSQWKGTPCYRELSVVSSHNHCRYMRHAISRMDEKMYDGPELLDPEEADAWFASLPHILERLTEKQQEILRLKYLEGYTVIEIAKAWGVTRRAVYSQLRAAIRRARKMVQFDKNPEAASTRDWRYRRSQRETDSHYAGVESAEAPSKGREEVLHAELPAVVG